MRAFKFTIVLVFLSLLLSLFIRGNAQTITLPCNTLPTRNLTLGSRGEDVRAMQRLLNISPDTRISETGDGSLGNETDFFGSLTKAAVIRFQNKYPAEILYPNDLVSGTGFVGASTRSKMNNLCSEYASVSETPAIPPPEPVNNNHAPDFDFVMSQDIRSNDLISIYIRAVDPDGDSLTYGVTALPIGSTFDPATRLFTWIPTQAQSGTHIATFVVTDGELSDTMSLKITVNGSSEPIPGITTSALSVSCTVSSNQISIGDAVTWTANALGDAGANTYTYTWTGSENLSRTGRTAITSYESAGTKTARVAVNSGAMSATAECPTITVAQPVGNTLNGSCNPNVTGARVGQQVTWRAIPVGGTGNYTYVWSGTDALSSTNQSVTKSYSAVGTKFASVTISSGSNQITRACINTVTVTQPYDPIIIENLSAKVLLDTLVTRGYLTLANRAQFIQNLTFDQVFTSLTPQELFQGLAQYGLTGGRSAESLQSSLSSYGINYSELRADGLLTILAFPRHRQQESLLSATPVSVKSTLQTSFTTNKEQFLDMLTSRRILEMLAGDNRTSPSDPRKNFFAYAWRLDYGDSTLPNVKAFPWLQSFSDPTILDPYPGIPALVSEVNAMPIGHRSVMPKAWPQVTTTSSSEYDLIWQEEGVALVAERYDNFFRKFKDAGGQLDIFIFDLEDQESMSFYYLSQQRSKWNPVSGSSIWQTIMADPRFPAISERLGFSDLTSWTEEKKAVWNTVMVERWAEYIHQSLVVPLKRHFPNARFVNYGNYHHNQTIPSNLYLFQHGGFKHGIGAVPSGWDQSSQLYPGVVSLHTGGVNGVYSATYNAPWNSFNSLLYAIATMRGMSGTSDRPIYPWISNNTYLTNSFGGSGYEHYGENVFHIALSGAEDFLYWNVPGVAPNFLGNSSASDQYVSRLLRELDEIVGYQNRKTLTRGPVTYNDNYVLSGMSAGGKYVWRFTPRPGSYILSSENPVIFTSQGGTFTIPNGRIHRPSVSNSSLGYWIVEDPQNLLGTDVNTVIYQLEHPAITYNVGTLQIAAVFTSFLSFFASIFTFLSHIFLSLLGLL